MVINIFVALKVISPVKITHGPKVLCFTKTWFEAFLCQQLTWLKVYCWGSQSSLEHDLVHLHHTTKVEPVHAQHVFSMPTLSSIVLCPCLSVWSSQRKRGACWVSVSSESRTWALTHATLCITAHWGKSIKRFFQMCSSKSEVTTFLFPMFSMWMS